ncbi:MAG TPA: SAM-dependent methyltransferase [Ignavibacteria bacterium]|nr:SAM-dependent methyltransferase [Ignavibacteria bacterium]HMR41541.1 SAM-dependent methyltransferase [Ignavibacteria bacterium]
MFTIEPIAIVSNSRSTADDDFWGNIVSEIIINKKISEKSLIGIDEFSHLEIIFYFHLADPSGISISSSHPRGKKDFPETGIFSQRRKARPNLLGTTIVKLLKVEKNILTVEGLDAVNDTPVIDIKPVFREFLPGEEIIQPAWVSELMKEYWKKK